jgi:hypothetical protein
VHDELIYDWPHQFAGERQLLHSAPTLNEDKLGSGELDYLHKEEDIKYWYAGTWAVRYEMCGVDELADNEKKRFD